MYQENGPEDAWRIGAYSYGSACCCSAGANYIGVGPLYETNSKADANEVV